MLKQVANWGNYPKIEAEVHELEFLCDLQHLVESSNSILARGNGRCYGDAALHRHIFSTLKLDKILLFDSENGIFTCQSGVLLAEIIQLIVPKGWFLPVTPGTKFITVGGAIAADVHGKNHHQEGCFADHLLYLDLMLADGQIRRCSTTENTDLFHQTIGNMGLTGIITQASFRLKSVETAYIRQEALQVPNLETAMRVFEESASWTYSVAWIDCLQKPPHLGRSVLMRGEHARLDELPASLRTQPRVIKKEKKITIPSFFPSFLLQTTTVKAFNFFYYYKQIKNIKKSIIYFDTFFYPLDSLYHWNRIYGKNGFIQYQFVLPKSNSEAGLRAILETIRKSGQGSFLTVLKLFGKPLADRPFSFPMEGYTLALDFKIYPKLPDLILHLDDLVQTYGGRIYRAKDALSSSELMQLEAPKSKFSSFQIERLLPKK